MAIVVVSVDVVVAVAVDAANFRSYVRVAGSSAAAAAVADVARYHQRCRSWLRERKRLGHLRVCLSVFDNISLELRARALTASERSSLAPRRALFLVNDSCDGELTIDSRLARHCRRIQYTVPGSENTLACLCLIRTDLNKGKSMCLTKTYRCPSH